MSDPKPGADIDAYLRQYHDKFTRDAMAARLMEAGHDPATVEAAMARLEAEHIAYVTAAVKGDSDATARARRVTRIVVLIVYALLVLMLTPSSAAAPGVLFHPATAVFLAIAAGVGIFLWWLMGRFKGVPAMVVASVLVVALGLPLALFGACLAGLGSPA